jgi:hypothetical protein
MHELYIFCFWLLKIIFTTDILITVITAEAPSVETLNMSYGNFLSRTKTPVRSKEQKNSGELHKM